MASSFQGKADSQLRLVSDKEAVVHPENAPSTDESPTVISKNKLLVEPQGSSQHKIIDLARKQATPESMFAGLRGRRLAHFELIEPIGVGGMAAVIRAHDTQLDRFVALKILPPEMAQEPENIQRFHQEARAAAKLDHENIARVFYAGMDQGLYFIAFEFVEGINLRMMLEQRGRLPVAESVRYILQIATGLEHAATRGVVHRDVKPSNIIITPTGRAKLVDMGLARNLERRGECDLTQSGVTLGTFDYLSPEQALEPREADARSDIYSLGCTLYHMLTGQPPVPEGTAAKKMHHHQHLSPIDPREIDSGIPDEIVMILGKMMAKNPKDRYQRPIHLVHHLMQVAQKVGVADDLPEGVLFVDAPLPSRPRSRPVLFVSLALAALVAVTLLVSYFPQEDPVGPSPLVNAPKKAATVKPDGPHPGPKQGDDVPAHLDEVKIKSLDDLHKVLSDPSKVVKAQINAPRIDLDGRSFKGAKDQRLVLYSDDVETNVLRFSYKDTNVPVGLVVEGGEDVEFRGIKFEIDSGKASQPIATVAVRGAKTVRFVGCIFPQNVPKISPKYVPVASVLIDAPEGAEFSKPDVFFNDCFFDGSSGGQAAIAINGSANVYVTNCAFNPHAMFFHFRDKCTEKNTLVKLDRCGGFVVQGPAFRLSPNASAQVQVDHSWFSRPSGSAPDLDAGPGPGLIFLAGNDSIRYEGRKNIYHNLNSLIEKSNKSNRYLIPPHRADEFQKYLKEHNAGFDKESLYPEHDASPLRYPSAEVADLLRFQLKQEFHEDFGLRSTWSGAMPAPAALVKVQPTTPKKKIVDANDNTPGIFNNVAEALSRAVDGDVIFIKHPPGDNRFVDVPPVALKPGLSVTLKPYEGCTPILVLDKAYKKKDSALFTVEGAGRLQIEHMEILLAPIRADYETQSIVHLGESAHCVFKNCIFSLRTNIDVQLNVVTFIDLGKIMKMDNPPASPAKVEFHECFVRGKGDLVALRGCRLLDVEIKNSLVALDGSLLDIEPANKAMPMNQGVRWKMERSSIFTTKSVFALRSKIGKVLTETRAEVERCLLHSLDPDQPVVVKDKANSGDLDKFLSWKGEENFYSNFDDLRRWEVDYVEMKSAYGKLTFPKLSEDNAKILWDALPEWFVPADAELKSISGFGLPVESKNRLMPAASSPDG